MKTDKLIQIGCIGDSITAGTGLENPKQEAFPSQLEMLLQNNVTVFNFGDGGKTMRGDLGIDSYTNSRTYQALLETADSLDIVTVMLGTNDAYHAKGWTETEKNTYRNDCKALFGILQKKNPSVKFVLMNSPECFGEKVYRYDMISLRKLQSELAEALNQAGFKTCFMDMYSVTKSLEAHFPDQLHPDATAHRLMAEALGTVIEKLIRIG